VESITLRRTSGIEYREPVEPITLRRTSGIDYRDPAG